MSKKLQPDVPDPTWKVWLEKRSKSLGDGDNHTTDRPDVGSIKWFELTRQFSWDWLAENWEWVWTYVEEPSVGSLEWHDIIDFRTTLRIGDFQSTIVAAQRNKDLALKSEVQKSADERVVGEAGWAKARDRFLRNAFPDVHRRWDASGYLAEHLRATGRDAQDMWELCIQQMRSRPELPTGYKSRQQWLSAIPEIVRELVMEDLIQVKP
ncbi:MAG: hypothetical protein ABL893_04680 [Hyphomicrobium sp.]